MRNHFPVAVHMFFLREKRVLLLRRFNTGWRDGMYSVPAGHVDAGESVIQAAIREAREEIGVTLTPSDLEVVHVMHRKSDDERIDFFLVAENWLGEIINKEPHKCDDLSWHSPNNLPGNIIPYIQHALENYRAKIPFSQFGW